MKQFYTGNRIWITACVIAAMTLLMVGCSCGRDNGGENSTTESTSQGGDNNTEMQSTEEISTSSTDGVNQMTQPEYGTDHMETTSDGAMTESNGQADAIGGGTSDPIYMPGTYTGSAKGYGGQIEVTVEVDETHILSIDAVGDSETPNVGQKAIQELTQNIIDANNTDIEGISGATYSSQGLFEAVNDALAQAYTGE